MPGFLDLLKQQIAKEYGPKNKSAQQLEAEARARQIPFSPVPIGPPPGPPTSILGPVSPTTNQRQAMELQLNAPIELASVRKSLGELAQHTLNNYDQLETVPLGDLFTKIPLGTGFYSRLIDSYLTNSDQLDANDHQRAVEAFGAPGFTPDLQDQIVQSLLKSFLSDTTDEQQQAGMTGYQVPSNMRLPMPTPTVQPPNWWQQQNQAAFKGYTAPPPPPVDWGAALAASNASAAQGYGLGPPAPTTSTPMPTPMPTQTPTSSMGGTDLEGTPPEPIQVQPTNVFQPTSLQLLEVKNLRTKFIDLYSPITNRKIGYYDETQKAIFTGRGKEDLRDASASGVFPSEQLQKESADLTAALKAATAAAEVEAEAEAKNKANNAQADYYSANASKTTTEKKILEAVEERNKRKFAIELEALKLDNALKEVSTKAKSLELSRTELDLAQARQSYPLDLQYKQEQLAMAQAQRQQLEQERARKSNMDTFAANFFPSLISAISPGDRANSTYTQLAQGAGMQPTDPMAQAAFALLQNNLRESTGAQ